MGKKEIEKYELPAVSYSSDNGIQPNGTTGNDDENLLKAISENLRYPFYSPLQTNMIQFPTPYSTNQNDVAIEYRRNRALTDRRNHVRKNEISKIPSTSQQSNTMDDSSIIENSMLAGFGAYANRQQATTNYEKLRDFNIQPSSVMNLGNSNLPNEHMLTSPEHLKEFLLDSPAGHAAFEGFHKTPAKTPLRFIAEKSGNSSTTKSTSAGLWKFPQDTDVMRSGSSVNKYIPMLHARTPLGKLDTNNFYRAVNLSASSNLSPSMHPSIDENVSPYTGKTWGIDYGTPYAKASMTSDSALVDFRNARKHNNESTESLTRLPAPGFSPQLSHYSIIGSSVKTYTKTPEPQKTKPRLGKGTEHRKSNTIDDNLGLKPQDLTDDSKILGSSPTTIQLNSSVNRYRTSNSNLLNTHVSSETKSPLGHVSFRGLETVISKELLTDDLEDSELDNETIARLQFSPTPETHFARLNRNDNREIQINKSELPKMGSFRSETALPQRIPLQSRDRISTQEGCQPRKTASSSKTKPRKITKKQPKFQIIVSSAQKFSSGKMFTSNGTNPSKKAKLIRSQSVLEGASQSTKEPINKRNGHKTDKEPPPNLRLKESKSDL